MESIYPNLEFPNISNRPFFYTNFVSTVDGKTQVLTDPKAYWPIGSELDYRTLIELRTYADLLIHGKNTALIHKTSSSLKKSEFKKERVKRGKKESLPYMVITGNPNEELINQLKDSECRTIIVTTTRAKVVEKLPGNIEVIRIGEERVDLEELAKMLFKMGIKNILV